MRSRLARVVTVAVLLAVTQLLSIPSAYACDPADVFRITPEHVASGDLNQPNSAMLQEFAEYFSGQGRPAPFILGGYLIETVHTVEPDGDWTRGSVSAVTTVWGTVPDSLGPFVVESADLSVVEVDSCGDPGDGPELGTKVYELFTDQGRYQTFGQDFDAALTEAFGKPFLADRDEQEEELIIARMGNARSGSGRNIAIAFGLILVVGGILSYRYRKARLIATWDEIVAEEEAKQAAVAKSAASKSAAETDPES